VKRPTLWQARLVRDLERHYADVYYANPDELAPWLYMCARYKAANVIALWRGEAPERLADVGCGDGSVLAHLDALGFGAEYTGFEISPAAIAMAGERSFARPAAFIGFDGISLPAEDGEFDLAILSHVVEHAPDPRGLITEAARVADWVFVEVPLELNARTPRDFVWTDLGHINLYDRTVIRQLVQSVGLEVVAESVTLPGLDVSVHMHGRPKGHVHWLIKRAALASGLGPRVLTYNGSLLARQPQRQTPAA
jgi:SAM-dependent methyltransferase